MFRPASRVIVSLLAGATLLACNAKPSEGDCRQAVGNMRRLLETDKVNVAGDVESAVRRCRGSSNKKSVQCAISATSLAELEACGLLPPAKPGAANLPEPQLSPPAQAAAGKPEEVPPADPAPAPGAAPAPAPAGEPAPAPAPAPAGEPAPAPAGEPAPAPAGEPAPR
jgi:hypothetical protein